MHLATPADGVDAPHPGVDHLSYTVPRVGQRDCVLSDSLPLSMVNMVLVVGCAPPLRAACHWRHHTSHPSPLCTARTAQCGIIQPHLLLTIFSRLQTVLGTFACSRAPCSSSACSCVLPCSCVLLNDPEHAGARRSTGARACSCVLLRAPACSRAPALRRRIGQMGTRSYPALCLRYLGGRYIVLTQNVRCKFLNYSCCSFVHRPSATSRKQSSHSRTCTPKYTGPQLQAASKAATAARALLLWLW